MPRAPARVHQNDRNDGEGERADAEEQDRGDEDPGDGRQRAADGPVDDGDSVR
jgi:hypothetical protein